MNDENVFEEYQSFRNAGIWIILFIINAFVVSGVYILMISSDDFDLSKPTDIAIIFFIAAIMILINLFFFSMRLETRINQQGIYVRFFPIHLRFQFYPWNKISTSFIKQYNAIGDHGGYGLRWTPGASSYTISGNKSIRITLTNNKSIVIGTQKPEVAKSVLKNLGHYVKP